MARSPLLKPIAFKPISTPLFGCLWLPQFPLWAALQANDSTLNSPPLVAAQKSGRIIAASEDATRRVLRLDWTSGRALSLFPDCLVLPFSTAHEKSA